MNANVIIIGDSMYYSAAYFGYAALGVPAAAIWSDVKPRWAWRKHVQHTADGPLTTLRNLCYPGTRINLDWETDLNGWKTKVNAMVANTPSTRKNILLAHFNTNQGPAPYTASVTAMENFIAEQKAAGFHAVILSTLPSRQDAGTAFDRDYATPYNAAIRAAAWQAANGVTIADIAANTLCGPVNLDTEAWTDAAQNATYFNGDKIHPTQTLADLMAPTIRAAINAQLTAYGCALIPTLTATPGSGQVALSWSDAGTGNWNVYYNTVPTWKSATLFETAATEASTVTGLSGGTPYYFFIRRNTGGALGLPFSIKSTPS